MTVATSILLLVFTTVLYVFAYDLATTEKSGTSVLKNMLAAIIRDKKNKKMFFGEVLHIPTVSTLSLLPLLFVLCASSNVFYGDDSIYISELLLFYISYPVFVIIFQRENERSLSIHHSVVRRIKQYLAEYILIIVLLISANINDAVTLNDLQSKVVFGPASGFILYLFLIYVLITKTKKMSYSSEYILDRAFYAMTHVFEQLSFIAIVLTFLLQAKVRGVLVQIFEDKDILISIALIIFIWSASVITTLVAKSINRVLTTGREQEEFIKRHNVIMVIFVIFIFVMFNEKI